MKRQFIKLFLLILVSLVFISWLTESFIEREQVRSASIDISSLAGIIGRNSDQSLNLSSGRVIAISKLTWPDDIKDKLSRGEVVSLSNIDNQVFYYWLFAGDNQQVVELGPFALEQDESNLYLSLTVLFYSVFALVLFIWLWPVFSDVRQLIELTNLFSKKRQKIRSSIKSTSVMSPLADSVESMSRQIVRFLSLQRFLASSISHDIRTPLARIGFLLAMTNPENINESKDRIEKELDEIDRLTDDFIELARIEEFHYQLNIQAQNLQPWLVELIEKIQHGTTISINIAVEDEVLIAHDAKFLQRAVQNLLANAVKYAEQQVNVTVCQVEKQLEIRVEDDGTGINPEEQERLTGLYERGKSSKNGGSGYGIGLAFVNVITEWHGGNVTIKKSALLNGACISVFLPNS
ncbi:ATP-binding protein [Thalassotalea fonticola]|uniref:histidine kinase n=1 Tax=Thalassotalea fonticola TaxID=3065649 RepID=A0ABZ0GQG2_9GAMM|nr:ATP-binding protein [Colwelliaceae bacterium S1-1]